MKLFSKTLAFSIMVILVSSCLSRTTPPQTSYYDLNIEVPETKSELTIGKFTAESQYNLKMVFRTKDNKVDFSSFHRWANNPEELLKNYCKMAFKPSADKTLNLHIIRLELNEVTSNMVFIADFEINDKTSRFSKQIKVDNNTPEAFSKAFNSAANELIKTINLSLK